MNLGTVGAIVGIVGGLLGAVGIIASAWAVARKGLKDQTIDTQATHITSQNQRIEGLEDRVKNLEVERDDCKTQLVKVQTTLDTVLDRLDRQPGTRSRRTDRETG